METRVHLLIGVVVVVRWMGLFFFYFFSPRSSLHFSFVSPPPPCPFTDFRFLFFPLNSIIMTKVIEVPIFSSVFLSIMFFVKII